MTRLVISVLPVTAGAQAALLRAMRKSAVIWLPDTVRVMSAIDASAWVAVIPEAALCITPLDRETTPPVALPGMLPTRRDASTPPPQQERLPLAARTVVPVAVTHTCAPD